MSSSRVRTSTTPCEASRSCSRAKQLRVIFFATLLPSRVVDRPPKTKAKPCRILRFSRSTKGAQCEESSESRSVSSRDTLHRILSCLAAGRMSSPPSCPATARSSASMPVLDCIHTPFGLARTRSFSALQPQNCAPRGSAEFLTSTRWIILATDTKELISFSGAAHSGSG